VDVIGLEHHADGARGAVAFLSAARGLVEIDVDVEHLDLGAARLDRRQLDPAGPVMAACSASIAAERLCAVTGSQGRSGSVTCFDQPPRISTERARDAGAFGARAEGMPRSPPSSRSTGGCDSAIAGHSSSAAHRRIRSSRRLRGSHSPPSTSRP
jgi:hypothetical protein